MFPCIDLATRGRPGPYAILVRPEKWKEAAFTAHALAGARVLGRSASAPTWIHDGTAGNVKSLSLDASHQSVQSTNIPAGKCLRISVGAEGEGTGLELRLYDAVSGDELDRSHGQTSASVRACAGNATRSVRMDARATAGKLDAILAERIF